MKYDPRFTEIRDRCRQLARTIRQGQTVQPDALARMADDLAMLADELNSLLNRLEERSRDDSKGFKPFESY